MEKFREILQDGHSENYEDLCFQTISLFKLVFLSLISFGVYEIIWAYSLWKRLKMNFGYEVSPFWRGYFSQITNFWLFPIIEKYIGALDSKKSFNGIFFAILYLVLLGCWRLNGVAWFICFGTTVILAIIQSKINYVNERYFPNAPKNKWNVANWIWSIPLTLLFIMSIIGTFLPDE